MDNIELNSKYQNYDPHGYNEKYHYWKQPVNYVPMTTPLHGPNLRHAPIQTTIPVVVPELVQDPVESNKVCGIDTKIILLMIVLGVIGYGELKKRNML